jgi:hypothetical protein
VRDVRCRLDERSADDWRNHEHMLAIC